MIKSFVRVVNPGLAEEMLKRNTDNYRSLKWNVIDLYAQEMKQGRWEENGEPIVFDEDGVLKNGQHRLSAIVKANVSIPMLIVEGVSRDVTAWDEGKVRTATERAAANGIVTNNFEIGAANLIIRGLIKRGSATSRGELVDFLKEHGEQMRKARIIASHGCHVGILRKAASIAAVYCALELELMNEKQLDAFCVIANSGLPNNEYVSEAPLVLRRMVQDGLRDAKGNVVISGGAFNKPMFEATWDAMKSFKDGRKLVRKFKPTCDGDAIIEETRKLYTAQSFREVS